ncbi:MAG: hypothetical protein EBU29_09200 [Gammaproteobacteria bacterium]|nr:hypothetical protein [Gammaproteobacteria bacterium]
MLKELGLGALLFIAGDSELGRRAGDALIADKIGDALEEGGFDAVSLGPWAVGRDEATLQAPEALDHLRFLYEDGGRSLEVSWAADSACAALSLAPAQGVPLLELRPFLATEGAAAEVRSSSEGCDHLVRTGRAAFSALNVSPALLEVFLEELPEAYTYLLR